MVYEFKPLSASDVECRVKTITSSGVQLLLYKNARVDMKQLDQVVGVMNWQRTHEFKDGNLYCKIGIWDPEKSQWIWKEDVGTESNVEAEKGRASDAFKRAGTCWGIGRELYTSPFIWINSQNVKIENIKGKNTTKEKFTVKAMEVLDGVITGLQIANVRTKKIVFSYGSILSNFNSKVEQEPIDTKKDARNANTGQKTISENQQRMIYAKANKEYGFGEEAVKKGIMKYFGKQSASELTEQEMDELLRRFDDAAKRG